LRSKKIGGGETYLRINKPSLGKFLPCKYAVPTIGASLLRTRLARLAGRENLRNTALRVPLRAAA